MRRRCCLSVWPILKGIAGDEVSYEALCVDLLVVHQLLVCLECAESRVSNHMLDKVGGGVGKGDMVMRCEGQQTVTNIEWSRWG